MKFSLLDEVFPNYEKKKPQKQEQKKLCEHCANNKNQIEKFQTVEIKNDFDIVLILLLAFIAYVILNPR